MQLYDVAVHADIPMNLMVLPSCNLHTMGRTHHTAHRMMDHFCRHLLGKPPPARFRFNLPPQPPEPSGRETVWQTTASQSFIDRGPTAPASTESPHEHQGSQELPDLRRPQRGAVEGVAARLLSLKTAAATPEDVIVECEERLAVQRCVDAL